MWMPSGEDFRLLQLSGGVALTLLFAGAVLPPLRPYGRRLGAAAAIGYIAFGAGLLLYRLLQPG